MMEAIIYIYQKKDMIRAINHIDAIKKDQLNQYLKKNGWKHVATINAADFIEVLCTKHPDKDFREKFIQYLIK